MALRLIFTAPRASSDACLADSTAPPGGGRPTLALAAHRCCASSSSPPQDISAILSSVGAEADADKLSKFMGSIAGKDIVEVSALAASLRSRPPPEARRLSRHSALRAWANDRAACTRRPP